jgi:hypothetical protein
MIARLSLSLFALLAAAPLLAQKPAADAFDSARARFRDRALATCVVDLNGAERVAPETGESVCGCAVGRFMSRWPAGALPRLEGARLPAAMSGDLIACAGEEDMALAASVARRVAQAAPPPPPAAPPAAVAPVVAVPTDKPPAERERRSDSGWFDGLSLPRWLSDSGLPIWALAPLGLLVLLFFRGLMRGGDERDLMGPPPGMRRTVTPPRRP